MIGSAMAIITKLTTKHQTTIPAEVRSVLGVKAGDQVEFQIENDRVTISKAKPGLSDDLAFGLAQATSMRDWDTPEDDEAFRDL